MSLYDYDSNIVGEQLTPPVLRKTKFLAWLYVIVKPIQTLWSQVFEDYKTGSIYFEYDPLATYNFGDRVTYTNKSVYEATYTDADGVAQSFNGVECTNTLFWTLINDNLFGLDERVKYNSQIILLEKALNRWYLIDSGSDQIYIENNTNIQNVFVMGLDSQYSSTMSKDSNAMETYMGLAPTYPDVSYDYIVWVPTTVYNALGSDNTNRTNNITNFVNKYNLSGLKFKIDTY